MAKPIIQPEAFDVASWLEDAEYFNYPEGARSKWAFFPPANLVWQARSGLVARRYLYKHSNKYYKDQFWGEIVAYYIGCLLDVEVPPTFVAYDSRKENDCGSLSQWFYEDGEMAHVLGGNWMQRAIPDYDHKLGEKHNFRTVQLWGRKHAPYVNPEHDWGKWWAEAFFFDALIGNTDRHQNNWGYLMPRSGTRTDPPRLSPLFDNGTSLGHERFPEHVAPWSDAKFQQYIMNGRHHMRWQITDPQRCGHFEMVSRVVGLFPGMRAVLRGKIENFSVDQLGDYLHLLSTLRVPIPLSQPRINLYLKLVSLRQRKLKEILS